MRHDDRANRPEVDPALGPSSGERGAAGGELYVPGDGDIELIDQAGRAPGDEDEEMVPSDSELQLTDDQQPYDPGYSAEAEPGGEGLALGDVDSGEAETPLFLAGLAPEFASQEPLFDASGELIVESSLDRPSEGRVSMPPPKLGGGAAAPRIPPPPALPSEESPWAADGEAAIDAGALPSSHSPVAAQDKPAASPPVNAAGEAAGGARSWLTIFLVIAVIAFGVTFLILFFNVGQTPQDPPGVSAPIQVPQGASTTAAAPAQVAPPPVVSALPVNTAPIASSSGAASAPSAEPSAEPIDLDAPSSTGVSIAPVIVTSQPAVDAAGAPALSASPKSKPPKKTNRIF